jgi:hypothetical protein
MMKILQTIVATVTTCFLMGCAGPVLAQTGADVENPKFLGQKKTVLGLNEKELLERLGFPTEVQAGGCVFPYKPESQKDAIPMRGNSWIYSYKSEEAKTIVIFYVCVIGKHAVAEEREIGVLEGSRAYITKNRIVDFDLIEKVYKGELDGSSLEERTTPPEFNGPEIEL